MDIIKLRNKILLEAMHGNIVKNDDSFSPVSIEASEEVGTFDIPSNWKWITIKDICNRLYAGGDKTKHFSKIETDAYNVPVVANGKDNDGIIGYTNIATENEKCFERSFFMAFFLLRNRSDCVQLVFSILSKNASNSCLWFWPVFHLFCAYKMYSPM
mgnify:CR=1 FL=1